MNFPRLKDTQFPNLETVDVYQFANTFDYTRWNENTKVRLVNVLWNSDYEDVVKFDTDAIRNAYFDTLKDGYDITLFQAARIVPENYVKLPIPYDVMARYNYLYIDMPIATNENTPLDYETNDGIRRWYFFINSIRYLSPNSTQVFLELDVWTNFINDVEINYMILERGHAAVYASDTDSYLQNPVGNSRWLLAPDVNYDNAGITRSADFVPFGNGTKYVCLASTCAYSQIQEMGTVTSDSDYTPFGQITYSDVDVRYGHQLQVNGLTIGNGRDYSNAKTVAFPGLTADDKIPNNLTIYAIEANELYGVNATFFTDVLTKCPQFLNTIKACFVVDENCITFGRSVTIAGHTLKLCMGAESHLFTKQLQKSDFNYPQELQRFAKLYTSPYAVLEVTDNAGSTFEVHIEETSVLNVETVTSVAFPYINFRVFLDGIGGVGSTAYTWKDLKNNVSTLNISNGDWFKYCFDWEIPTFALFMDAETAYQLESFNRNTKQGINNALVGYHTTMRSANTDNKNACDSADTAHTNTYNSAGTAKTNAYNSAETGKTNTDNAADAAKTNADNDTALKFAVTGNDALTAKTNQELANALTRIQEKEQADLSESITSTHLVADANHVNVANAITTITTNINAESTCTTTRNNNTTGVVTGAASGIASGAGTGVAIGGAVGMAGGPIGAAGGAVLGASLGAVVGITTSGISAVMGTSNASVVNLANQQAADATTSGNVTDHNITSGECTAIALAEKNLRYSQADDKYDMADAQIQGNYTTTGINATLIKDCETANSLRTQTTTKTNAANTRDTSEDNADNTYDTDTTNADNTQTVVKNNSGYSRDVAELNAKEVLENAARNAQACIDDARNNQPRPIGNTTGNPTADCMRTRGIQIKVKTQSDSAIRQTGTIFARYGYAVNQQWDIASSGLKLMRHFTYWKTDDIWVDDKKASTNAVQKILTGIFNNGVTVWNKPEEIGRVSVYAN